MHMPFKSVLTSVAMLAGASLPAAAQEACGLVVFFESGQASVDAADAAALRGFVSANSGAALSVTGYTDAAGSAASNAALSQTRAEAVAASLAAEGAVTIASVQGLGEAVRPGTTGPDDPANRRVEVVNADCGNVVVGPLDGSAGLAALGGIGALAIFAAGDNDSSSSSSTPGTD